MPDKRLEAVVAYLKQVSKDLARGDSTEHTHRPAPRSKERSKAGSLSGPGAGEGKGEVGVFGPEDVFDYIYAIFHSPTYRKRYAEFLKIDFPRVPLTSDKKLFWKLVALGRELVALHLLEASKVDDFVTEYPKKGTDTVEKVQYAEGALECGSRAAALSSPRGPGKAGAALPQSKAPRVYINSEQYYDGVIPEWFEFHIGGYQVLQK